MIRQESLYLQQEKHKYIESIQPTFLFKGEKKSTIIILFSKLKKKSIDTYESK